MIAVRVIADAGDIVAECVKPHIDNMAGCEIYRNAPCEGASGDAQILQSGQQEVVHHLVLAGYGLDELRVRVDVLDQAVGVFLHLEEVSVFLGLMHFAAADGAILLIHYLGRCVERLALSAVHSLIITKIDIALVVQLLEDLLYLALMVFICCADEAVVGSVDEVPESLDLSCHFVYEFLGSLAGCRRSGLDLLTVLVTAGLEMHVIAVRFLVSCDAVSQNDLIRISDMRLAGCVCDRCCNVIFPFILHRSFPLLLIFPIKPEAVPKALLPKMRSSY